MFPINTNLNKKGVTRKSVNIEQNKKLEASWTLILKSHSGRVNRIMRNVHSIIVA
jgi:hypothetical protein